MVSVSSNINVYSNLTANESVYEPVKVNIFVDDFTQNKSITKTDNYENSQINPFSSYSEQIQSKIKQNNQKYNNLKNPNEKTPVENKEIENLQKIDQRVRAHEQAHLAAGAGLIRGGATFEYTRGPDGKMYAVGGEVKIDISPVAGKPDETIRKMQRVISAALAPADPSPQDRAVATIARNIQSKAQMEKTQEALKNMQEKKFSDNSDTAKSTNNITNQSDAFKPTINKNEQVNDKIDSSKKVIKKYIINNPYQNLDRILYKSV